MTTKRTLAEATAATTSGIGEQMTKATSFGSKRPPSRRGKIVWLTYLDPDTHRRVKAAAALEGKSLQRIGEEAAEALIRRTGL